MERNENGFSGREVQNSTERRNSACPGTGEIWRRDGRTNNGNGMTGDEMCSDRQLAMMYSPVQCWRMLYSPDRALLRGTLFEELDKPLEDCRW